MVTRRDEFVATVLDGQLRAIRARYEARLGGERARIAAGRQRSQGAVIVAQREARVAVSRAVAQAREAVRHV